MRTCLMTIVFFVVLTAAGFAQLEKGTWIGGINGSLGLSGFSSNNYSIKWSFDPYAMYLVSKNFAVGFEFDNKHGYICYRHNYDADHVFSLEMKSYFLQPALTARKYFGTRRFRPYIGISTGMVLFHEDYHYFDHMDNYYRSSFSYFIAPQIGASWWIKDKLYLDMNARFNYSITNNLPGYFDFKIGAGFKIGK